MLSSKKGFANLMGQTKRVVGANFEYFASRMESSITLAVATLVHAFACLYVCVCVFMYICVEAGRGEGLKSWN